MRTLLLLLIVFTAACNDPVDAKKEKAEQAHLLSLAQCVCSNKGGVQLAMYGLGMLKFVCKEDHTPDPRYVTSDMSCYP